MVPFVRLSEMHCAISVHSCLIDRNFMLSLNITTTTGNRWHMLVDWSVRVQREMYPVCQPEAYRTNTLTGCSMTLQPLIIQ